MRSPLFNMAALLQYLVFCKAVRRSLFNWRISAISPPTLTFSEFYVQQLENVSFNRRLESVFVGQSKEDCTSEVDKNLSILDVTHSFGQYVKFFVELADSATQSNADIHSSGGKLHAFISIAT